MRAAPDVSAVATPLTYRFSADRKRRPGDAGGELVGRWVVHLGEAALLLQVAVCLRPPGGSAKSCVQCSL